MRTSNEQIKKVTSIVGKISMALVFASMIGGLFLAPASARADDRRDRRYEQGRYEHGRRAHRPPPRGRYYPPPVYAPPPVVYAPAPYQSPGITLVFPIRIR